MQITRRDFLKLSCSIVVIGIAMPQAVLAASVSTPVLMYHDISNDYTDEYTTSPATFAAEMEWLYAHGYAAIACSDLGASRTDGKKPVIITFDDGYASFIDYAFPLMQQYGFKATINVIASKASQYIHLYGNRPLLSWDEYRFLTSSGAVELGCHSFNMHMRGGVKGFSESEFEQDLIEFQKTVRREIGRTTDILAWPYGIYADRYIEIAKQSGFRYLLTSNEGIYSSSNRLDEIPRLAMNDKLDLLSFQQYLGERT